MATQTQSMPTTRLNLTKKMRRFLRDNEWLYIVIGICIGILLPYLIDNLRADAINTFITNLVPEAVGIFFTVLIIDRLDSVREQQVIKDQLVRRIQSRYNHTALQAIEEMRVIGYLEDGTLRNRNMRGSNWVDANMYMADLRGSDLGNANLENADFVKANLKDVNITDQQLVTTDIMYGAIMPDGRKYDGRYQLKGDYDYAQRERVNIQSQEAMAKWFGVPIAQYREGQRWAAENLHKLRK